MKLSDRLNAIYEFIRPGEMVADIGSDHGFIAVKLIEEEKSPYIILSDISEYSLLKGKKNIDNYENNDIIIDCRMGDGLKTLDYGEVDDVIIAGIGGRLIVDILSNETMKTSSFPKLILQPRNHSGELRYWLYNNGYNITNDIIVRENKYIPEIIVAVKGMPLVDIKGLDKESIELEVPITLCDNDKDILIEFLNGKIDKTNVVLENLKKSSDIDLELFKKYEYRLNYLKYFLEKVIL